MYKFATFGEKVLGGPNLFVGGGSSRELLPGCYRDCSTEVQFAELVMSTNHLVIVGKRELYLLLGKGFIAKVNKDSRL